MAFRNLPEMPCGPILELHGQRKRFHVPYGLKRLIEDMTREVLRYQPQNIYEFLAVFMESRLQKRLSEEEKNQKRKSWQQHRWSWQGASVLEPNELKEFLEQLPAPEEEVNHHAIVIQAAFRGYQARKKVKEIRKSIQIDDEKRKSQMAGLGDGKASSASDKGKKSQDENDNKKGPNMQRRNTMDITPVNATEEEIHSAVIIQAAWRGAHARNAVKNLRASLAGSSGKKSEGHVQKLGSTDENQTQKRGTTEDTQAQKQENVDQSEVQESNGTMTNAQQGDAGMNKENETGASGENGQDKQGMETVDGGQPTEESSNANDTSQQQQETSNQPTGEIAEAPPANESQRHTEARKSDEGGQKPEEQTKPQK